MSGVTYEPPTENLAIFDDSVFQVDNAPLTIAKANKLYLKYPNAQGTENMQTTNVNGLLTMNAGGVVADTALTFRDATDDTGNISGVSGSLVLTALNDMTFATNSSGVHPLVLSTGTTLIQADAIDLNGNVEIALSGGEINLDSGVNTTNLAGDTLNVETDTISLGTLITTTVDIGNAASTVSSTGTIVNSSASTKITLNSPSIICVSDGMTFTTPELVIQDPVSNETYLQVITDYTAGLTDAITLFFSSTTLASRASIGINGLTEMAMQLVSSGSISLDAPADKALLYAQPTYPSITPTAIATTQYVSSAIAAIPAPISDILIGSYMRLLEILMAV